MMIKSCIVSAALVAMTVVNAFVPMSHQHSLRSAVGISVSAKRNQDDEDAEAARRRLEREWGHQFNQNNKGNNNNNNNGGPGPNSGGGDGNGPQYGSIEGYIEGYVEPGPNPGYGGGRQVGPRPGQRPQGGGENGMSFAPPARFGGAGVHPYRNQQEQHHHHHNHHGNGGGDPRCPMCHGTGKAYLGGTKPIDCPQCSSNSKHANRLPPMQGWTKGAVEVPVLDDPNSNADYWIQDRQYQEDQQYQQEHNPMHGAPPMFMDEEDEYSQSYGHISQSPYAPSIEFGPAQPQQDEGWIRRGFEDNAPPNFNEGYYDDDEMFGDQQGNNFNGGGGGYPGPGAGPGGFY